MEYRRLGKSGLKASEIGLGSGGSSWPGTANEKSSFDIVNHALEFGINFIDTSDTAAEGRAEILLGKALKGKRSQVVIATKFRNRGIGSTEQPGSRNNIMKAVEVSLKRLETDYIDLYYMHFPDPETPIEETLRSLDDLVRVGKVRYIGCSNFAGWQLCEALMISKTSNLESFIVVQSSYSLMDRAIERELIPCCQAYGVGVIPLRPLAAGFLTGKYRRGQESPAGARLSAPRPRHEGQSDHPDMFTDANFDKLANLEAFAKERGHSVGELALAWLLSHPWLSSVIPGATSVEQVKLN